MMNEAVETSGLRADPSAPKRNVIQSFAPITGELLGEVPVMAAEQVKDVVSRARRAQELWAVRPIADRCQALLVYRDAILDHSEELCDLLARETGKPRHEALLHEVMIVADLITYFANEAPRILASEERSVHLLKYRKSIVSYAPRGVVGVIGPWNFPLQLPLRDVIAAVVAGNAAVVKPSEVTPLIMARAKALWDECGMPEDLLGVVTGLGATGAALLDSGINLCVFTGSVGTGKRVAAACGERLIPCILELGGKAPLIACADCDVERTARAIVNGGFANSGQICISVERVYAHRDIHDRLVDRVVELTRELRSGDPSKEFCDIGGVTFEHQIDVAEKHIADAVTKGARVRCGGKRIAKAKMAFEPTVIDGCDHTCTVMTEEIFGPIVPIMTVSSEEEAIQLANASHLGLNAYVFTESDARGRRIAERIEAGSVVVNDVLINGGMPEAPFGGMKQSGYGRVMGEEGLRAMCHVRHLCLDRVKLPAKSPIGFPYTETTYRWFQKGIRAMFRSGGVIKRLSQLF
ncbi:MAG: aldehyde dehydrogenase family protein [Myxococcales bacterium]|nr:aldehyde dehydrogenase family protein [Myxococcales bacterium]